MKALPRLPALLFFGFLASFASHAEERLIAWYVQPQWQNSTHSREPDLYGLTPDQQVVRLFSSENSVYPVRPDQIERVYATETNPTFKKWKAKINATLSQFATTPGDHHLLLYVESHGVPGHLMLHGESPAPFLSYADMGIALFDSIRKHNLQKRVTVHFFLDACKSGPVIEMFKALVTAKNQNETLNRGLSGTPYAFRIEIFTSCAEAKEAQGAVIRFALHRTQKDKRLGYGDGYSAENRVKSAYEQVSRDFFAESGPQYWSTDYNAVGKPDFFQTRKWSEPKK